MKRERFDLCFNGLDDGMNYPPRRHAVFLLELDSIEDYPANSAWPTELLYVTVFLDASKAPECELIDFLSLLMDQGCVVFDAVGKEAAQVHFMYDDIMCQREIDDGRQARTTITGNPEEDDSLDEALLDSLFSSGPAEEFVGKRASFVFITIDNAQEANRIRSLFADPTMKWATDLLSGDDEDADED